MPIVTCGYAAYTPKEELKPFKFERPDVGPEDIHIEVTHSGICHTDIHFARDEWMKSGFPMVPGHEILGKAKTVGKNVKDIKVGDTVAIGCLIDSCKKCTYCNDNVEQYCDKKVLTYADTYKLTTNKKTYGGYSRDYVVKRGFCLKVPSNLDPAGAAPLLCAGVTVWTPLVRFGLDKKKDQRVGVVGLGGLGHMAVKFAKAMGHHVTVFSRSEGKRKVAMEQLKADAYVISTDPKQMEAVEGTMDFICDTVSAKKDARELLKLVKCLGTLCFVGLPAAEHGELTVDSLPLVFGGKCVCGSLIGGLKITQDMLDFCGKHNVVADVETIGIDYINKAFERMLKSDVKFRFVIDMSTCPKPDQLDLPVDKE